MRLIHLLAMLWIGSAIADVAAAPAPEPLVDPIPAKIPPGDILVKAVPFVRLPQTFDPHDQPTKLPGIDTPLPSSGAHARIQYLIPVRDGSRRLVISDLRGLLYMTDAAGKTLTTYLDLRTATADFDGAVFPNEAGLLGFAFHPDFARTGAAGFGKFYTGYSARRDSGVARYLDAPPLSHKSVIREWTTAKPAATRFEGTSRELFRVGQFAQNHNISTLAFNHTAKPGSADYGMLYVGMGDGGGAYDTYDYGQSLAEPLGALLRIDPLGGDAIRPYGIPDDNPFVTTPGAAPEIWAYGLRHPQHFSFDNDGRLFINDIGQNQVEEVNLGSRGANYGWHLQEGTFLTGYGAGVGISAYVYPLPEAGPGDAFVGPVAQYDHDEGNAISSGFVYRGQSIPALQGQYVAADIVRGRLFYFNTAHLLPGKPAELKELRIAIDGIERPLIETVGYSNTYSPGNQRADLRLGVDDAGELYLLTKGDGWVRKLEAQ
jgi:glucose/arabinose dehydrogenase